MNSFRKYRYCANFQERAAEVLDATTYICGSILYSVGRHCTAVNATHFEIRSTLQNALFQVDSKTIPKCLYLWAGMDPSCASPS